MSDSDTLTLIQAFLNAPRGGASSLQAMAWDDFYRIHDPMIRKVIKRCDTGESDVDDLDQDVWWIFCRQLSKYDPARGTLAHGSWGLPAVWRVGKLTAVPNVKLNP